MLKVVQNDPDVPPGLILDVLREGDIPFELIPVYGRGKKWRLASASGVIVLGGIMSVRDTVSFPFLKQLKEELGELIQKDIPYLGICLGGQLLAEVLGMEVRLQERGEKGCHRIDLTREGLGDPLFAGVPAPFPSFQWHNDSFDLPPGALHLARTDGCPCQAFRWGPAAYGIQFHPEVNREIVSDWCSLAKGEEAGVLDVFLTAETAYREASLTFIGNFLKIVRRRRLEKTLIT